MYSSNLITNTVNVLEILLFFSLFLLVPLQGPVYCIVG